MTAVNCVKSPTIQLGQTWATFYANITVNAVYDAYSGKITVKPSIGTLKTPTTLNVRKGECFIFITSSGNFRVIIDTVFLGSAGTKIMKIRCCDEV